MADISWTVPTVGLVTATFVPGSPGHSWQNAAAAGTTIGVKGAIVAAKTMALTGADIFTNPKLIADAKAELKKSQGPNFAYKAMVGDRKPPLDYRKASARRVAPERLILRSREEAIRGMTSLGRAQRAARQLYRTGAASASGRRVSAAP